RMLPTPPPNPLLALLQAALGQAHPLMDGSAQQVPYQAGVGAGLPFDPGGPMRGGGDVMTPPPTHPQGQGLAPPDGGLGENAHLGWGTAPPMDYHTALASTTHPHVVNPHAMPQPGTPASALKGAAANRRTPARRPTAGPSRPPDRRVAASRFPNPTPDAARKAFGGPADIARRIREMGAGAYY
ncbi:MAG TPA: hypothetical protein VNN79_19045, partial [Actinomycetota bacterium]|nr:hypothetical protein [Actinomycetota bacterium]